LGALEEQKVVRDSRLIDSPGSLSVNESSVSEDIYNYSSSKLVDYVDKIIDEGRIEMQNRAHDRATIKANVRVGIEPV